MTKEVNMNEWLENLEKKRPRLFKRAFKLLERNCVTLTEGCRSFHFTVKDGEFEYLSSTKVGDWSRFTPCSCKFGVFNGTNIPCSHVLAGILLLKSNKETYNKNLNC